MSQAVLSFWSRWTRRTLSLMSLRFFFLFFFSFFFFCGRSAEPSFRPVEVQWGLLLAISGGACDGSEGGLARWPARGATQAMCGVSFREVKRQRREIARKVHGPALALAEGKCSTSPGPRGRRMAHPLHLFEARCSALCSPGHAASRAPRGVGALDGAPLVL